MHELVTIREVAACGPVRRGYQQAGGSFTSSSPTLEEAL
jgi:hypothetical protein